MRTKLDININEAEREQEVYCLKMPNGNFSVNNTIVHNCRGYRSQSYPNGIDNDQAQYLSSLVPSERGFLWTLEDVLYGNEEKGRKPVKQFIDEVAKYPGLVDIMLGIQGLVKQRGSHASGVIFFDEDPYEFGAFMKTPSGDIITQFDLHSAESMGMTKFDFLVTDVQDKIAETIRLLQENNEIAPELTLRQAYEKYLHPEVLPLDFKPAWDAIENGSIINIFQFDSIVGAQAAKKVMPKTIMELCDANGSTFALTHFSTYQWGC